MISVNDLLTFLAVFIGSCLVAAIGVLLIIALVNFIKMAKKFNKLIDDNTEHVNKTLKQLPGLAENLDKASISVKVNADKVGVSFSSIEGVFTGTPATGDDSNTLLTIVSIAEGILKAIIGFFAKKERE